MIAVGRGWTREPSLTAWNVNWVEVPQPGTHRGYKRATGAVVRWGRNEIDAVDMDFAVSGRVTRAFLLSFDELGLPDEMQVVAKDSGGGVYVKRGADWELVGIQFLLLIPLPLDGQPADTAVFGDLSGVVDVSFYHDQIIATINPQIPGLPGASLFGLAALLLAAARPMLRRLPR